ncbi:hypothetical protein GE09DRAFT_1064954 [Coniochaeta sp. 2T2.1]|nr:hypothetical protein GE09DRAFT_1064954 [Coniochaeta sp. 2T2.1]
MKTYTTRAENVRSLIGVIETQIAPTPNLQRRELNYERDNHLYTRARAILGKYRPSVTVPLKDLTAYRPWLNIPAPVRPLISTGRSMEGNAAGSHLCSCCSVGATDESNALVRYTRILDKVTGEHSRRSAQAGGKPTTTPYKRSRSLLPHLTTHADKNTFFARSTKIVVLLRILQNARKLQGPVLKGVFQSPPTTKSLPSWAAEGLYGLHLRIYTAPPSDGADDDTGEAVSRVGGDSLPDDTSMNGASSGGSSTDDVDDASMDIDEDDDAAGDSPPAAQGRDYAASDEVDGAGQFLGLGDRVH